MRTVKIVLKKGFDKSILRGSVFITGFPGFGLVGYLTSKHIALTLKMEKIGFIKTKYMPETTFYVRDVGLMFPFELYYKEVDGVKLLILVNHSIPHIHERTYFAETIVDWIKEIDVKEAILVGGLDPSVKEYPDEKYRWIPLGPTNRKLDGPMLEERYVIGPLALTMMFVEANNIPGIAIFPYAEPYRADPKATAVAITIISEMLGLKIDVTKLYREAAILEEIENRERELIRRVAELSERRAHPMYM